MNFSLLTRKKRLSNYKILSYQILCFFKMIINYNYVKIHFKGITFFINLFLTEICNFLWNFVKL